MTGFLILSLLTSAWSNDAISDYETLSEDANPHLVCPSLIKKFKVVQKAFNKIIFWGGVSVPNPMKSLVRPLIGLIYSFLSYLYIKIL